MNVLIRTDASTVIGSGHVMRCLTLADALRTTGARVTFASRPAAGDLCSLVEQRGYVVRRLSGKLCGGDSGAYGDIDREVDDMRAATDAGDRLAWLIIDHYGIDRRWEHAMRDRADAILVIDDLGDRSHDCDVLLDQNFESARHAAYATLIPAEAARLFGPTYALVRPEFAERRPGALRRRDGRLERVLVSMGGSDPDNDTERAVYGLSELANDGLRLDVVIGAGNPHRESIEHLCAARPGATLHVQTSRMAELMSNADLAICGAGSTTWERCVVGLPGVVVIQSADQAPIAESMARAGADQVVGWSRDLTANDYHTMVQRLTRESLLRMSRCAAPICDGLGARRVADHLMNRNR